MTAYSREGWAAWKRKLQLTLTGLSLRGFLLLSPLLENGAGNNHLHHNVVLRTKYQ